MANPNDTSLPFRWEPPPFSEEQHTDAGEVIWQGLWQQRLVQPGNRYLPGQAPPRLNLMDILGGVPFFSDIWGRQCTILPQQTTSEEDWLQCIARLAIEKGAELDILVADDDGKRAVRQGEYSTVEDVVAKTKHQLLALRDAHRVHPFIQELHHAFSQFFRCPVTTGLYLNGEEAPGFREHHDAHHVFALQLLGKKKWWTGRPVLANANRRYLWDEKENTGRETIETGLGQWLYLPPGLRHRAKCSHDISLHVTFGVHAPHMVDAIENLVVQSGRYAPQLRASLPMRVGKEGVRWAFPEALLQILRPILHDSIPNPMIMCDGTPVYLLPDRDSLQKTSEVQGFWPTRDGCFVPWQSTQRTALLRYIQPLAEEWVQKVPALESVYARGSVLEDESSDTVFDIDLVLVFAKAPSPGEEQVLAECMSVNSQQSWCLDVRRVMRDALHDGSAPPYLRLCLAARSELLAGLPVWNEPPKMRVDRVLAQQLANESALLWHQVVSGLHLRPAISPQQRFPDDLVAWLQKRALRFIGFEAIAVGVPFTRHPVGCVTLAERHVRDLAPLMSRVCASLLQRDASTQASSDALALGTEWIRRIAG